MRQEARRVPQGSLWATAGAVLLSLACMGGCRTVPPPSAPGREAIVTVREGRQLAEHLRIAWYVEIPRPVFHGIRALYADKDLVLVESTYDLLVALDAKTGEARWVLKNEAPLDHPPCSAGNRLFFFSKDYFCVVDRDSGTLVARKNPHLGVVSAPCTDGRLVYVTSADGRAYGVREEDLWPEWSRGMESMAVGTALAAPTIFCVATIDADLLGINAANGAVLWRASLGEKAPMAGPAASQRMVYLAGRDFFARAFDLGGNEVWRAPVEGVAFAPPRLAHGKLFVTTGPEDKGAVVALDAASGARLWRREGPNLFLTASPQRAYFLMTRDGKPLKVVGFDLEDGTPCGALDAREFQSVSAEPDSGRFAVATADGRVYGIVDTAAADTTAAGRPE